MSTSDQLNTRNTDPSELPFAAPCRILDVHAPVRWLRLGWQDLRRAPAQSITYGFVIVLISYIVSFLAWRMGNYMLLLGLLSGFVFLGPVLAIGMYSISCQLKLGLKPMLGYCLREGRRHLGNEMVFAMVLLVVFLIWARAASTLHIFFPEEADPEVSDLILFLGIGSVVGSVFAAIIFCASAFSLPMIMDRKVDAVSAIVTSVNAVLRNKLVMLIWASLIILCVLIGFVTAFLGLAVLLPLIGHATWHAYQETIIADAWPKHQAL